MTSVVRRPSVLLVDQREKLGSQLRRLKAEIIERSGQRSDSTIMARSERRLDVESYARELKLKYWDLSEEVMTSYRIPIKMPLRYVI